MANKKYTSRYSGAEIDALLNKIPSKADNLFFNTADDKLYLTSEGEIIGDGVVVSTGGGGVLYNHRIGLYLGFSLTGSKRYAFFNIQTPDSEPYTADNLYSKLQSYGYGNTYIPVFWVNTVASGKKWLILGVSVFESNYLLFGLDYTNSTTPTVPKDSMGLLQTLATLQWASGGEMTDTVTALTK